MEWWQVMGGTVCACLILFTLFMQNVIIPRIKYDEENDKAYVIIRKVGA